LEQVVQLNQYQLRHKEIQDHLQFFQQSLQQVEGVVDLVIQVLVHQVDQVVEMNYGQEVQQELEQQDKDFLVEKVSVFQLLVINHLEVEEQETLEDQEYVEPQQLALMVV
jgi:hypothetical protein